MVYVGMLLLLVAVIALLVAIFADDELKAGAFGVTIVGGLVGVGLLVGSSVTSVDAGTIGVKTTFGDVSPEIVDPGIHLVSPFCTVKEMSTRTDNYWMSHDHKEGDKTRDDSVSVRSSNGLQMPVDVSVPYRLIPSSAPWVYKNLGLDYVEKLLRPAVSTAARRAASHYLAEELYASKRDEFAKLVETNLAEELQKILQDNYKGQNPPEQVLVINQVLIGYVGIPDSVKHAIESKLKADQEQQAMDFTIMREKKEAERKKVEAEGIQKFQEIVSKGIDDRLLRWKAIDATLQLAGSNNAKVVIIGAGRDGLPVLLNGNGEPTLQTQPK
jgi:regulator of protease activity HflC (stomatin/prohibitin superfamily)